MSPIPLYASAGPIAQVEELCTRFARSRHPVLILGAPGTGKTVLAGQLHRRSRRDGPFVAASAAGIPQQLELSDLCGHVRGAFTGAASDRMGLLEGAHGGTFFLDELGVASARIQEILLQLLDTGAVRRVGEVRTRPVDVRFVAATNADLEQMIAEGAFRRDLRDRFGYMVIRMPTLAERRDEILPLAERFLRVEFAALGAPTARIVLSSAVRRALREARWPGNIRELEAVCRYAALSATPGQPIELADLPPEFLSDGDTLLPTAPRAGRATGERLKEALAATGGNKAQAARLLGISRTQVYRLLEPASPGECGHPDRG